MATNFPSSDDVFTEPSSPGTTALSSAGTGSRNHSQHHRDLGDAIEAMQAQATLVSHSHDGSTARHGSKIAQANTHESADTDSSTSSIHHTIGSGANQAAAGNHTHSSVEPWPVGSVYMSFSATNPSSFFGGTWTALTNRFLVGAGDVYIGAETGGANTHTHTNPDASLGGSHSHTNPTTSSSGSHTHTQGSTGSVSSHSHGIAEGTDSILLVQSVASSGVWASSQNHDHNNTASGGSHSHTNPTTASSGSHTHTQGSTDSASDHVHALSDSNSSNNVPLYLAVYMWRRTA